MLSLLVGFEARYQCKQLSFIIFTVLFFTYGVFITADEVGQGMELLKVNSPYRLNFFIAITSITTIWVSAFFCVNNVLRDKEYQFDTVVANLAIEQRFFSRLFIATISSLFTVSLISLGMFIGLLSPALDADKIALIHFNHYFKPWLLFVLPNVVTCTIFLFAITYKWQRSQVTYLAAVSLFSLFWLFHLLIGAPIVGNAVSAKPELLLWLALLDPFGVSAFFEQSQFWTPMQKNKLTIALEGGIIWNRLIFGIISLLVLINLKRSLKKPSFLESASQKSPFNMSLNALRLFTSQPKAEQELGSDLKNVFLHGTSSISEITVVTTSRQYFFSTLLEMSKFEISKMINDMPFRILVVTWGLLVAMGIYMVVVGASGGEVSGRLPTTELLINQCSEMLLMFTMLMVVFFCGEKIWCERSLKMSALLDSTAVPSVVIAGAKLLSLFFIPLFLISVLIVLAIIYQLINGYYDLNIGHYLSMYYFFGLPLVIKTISIFLIQMLLARSRFGNKYIAVLISGTVLILLGNIVNLTGIEHPLLQINHLPDMSRVYTEAVGYGLYADQFNWYAILWGLLAISILAISLRKWSRGDWLEKSELEMSAKSHTNKVLSNIAIVFCGLALSVAMIMAYHIHWNNDYQTSIGVVDDKERYERKYRAYQDLIVPQVVNTKTTVDIFPKQHLVNISGNYQLKNTFNASINRLFISAPYPLEILTLDGAELTVLDEKWHVYIIDLPKPLLPGATAIMKYQLKMTSNSFAIEQTIADNGTHIAHRQFTPFFGYSWRNEIQDPYERSKRGLPEKSEGESVHALYGGDPMLVSEKTQFETIISTSSPQIAVTSGVLVNQWQEKQRSFYHYKADKKIFTPTLVYFSADYQVKKVQHHNTDIEMYYYPAHDRNIEEMIAATKAALTYGERHFGEYIYPSLRILEVPGSVGKASPGVISMGQNLYIRDSQDGADINVVARRTIHEVAHQWWGEKLTPEFVRGSGFLIESMAMYMQSAVLEELYGSSMPLALASRNQRRYFLGRAYAREAESALTQSMLEQYLIYSKGSTVLFAIRDLIGIEKFDRVLNKLIEQHASSITATIDSFIEQVYLVADTKQSRLIDDWLNKRIVYHLSIHNAEVYLMENGTYSVEFELYGLRESTDDKGNNTNMAIDEPIEIALFSAHPFNKNIKPIVSKTIYIDQQKTKVRFTLAAKPEYIMVDPEFTRLDQNLTDNIVKFGEK